MKNYCIQIGVFFVFFITCGVCAQIPCNNPSISGVLKYDNSIGTPMCYSMVYLKSPAGSVIDSSTTDAAGIFQFCQVPLGNYVLTARTLLPWGGVNSTDAFGVLHHFAQYIELTGLSRQAANVKFDQSINAIDALLIAKRFTGMNSSFGMSDWLFSETQLTIVDTTALNTTILARCTGDVDGSYQPGISFECGDTLIDYRDLQLYPSVLIGNQCWMAKNLNIGIMVTDHSILQVHSHCSDNNLIEKYCYNNDPLKCEEYGGLYDWDEMMQYDTTPGIQGICPDGWHIPSNNEWCELSTFLDSTVNCDTIGFTGMNAGGKLKETGTTHWKTPNTGATNSTGFNSIGTGNRATNGGFALLKTYQTMWSSTSDINGIAVYFWATGYNTSKISTTDGSPDQSLKLMGVSVRCILDN